MGRRDLLHPDLACIARRTAGVGCKTSCASADSNSIWRTVPMSPRVPFRSFLTALAAIAVSTILVSAAFAGEQAQQQKPNILVLWGDDIGTWNISHNSRGMMGYSTPNIDRI